MTADGITQLINENAGFGKIPAGAGMLDCMTAFKGGCLTNVTVSQGRKTLGTTYSELDLSTFVTITRQQEAVVVLLVYPQGSSSIKVACNHWDDYTEDWTEDIYEAGQPSPNGNPVPFVWKITTDTYNDAVKPKLKLGVSGYVKWHLLKFFYCTGLDEEEEET